MKKLILGFCILFIATISFSQQIKYTNCVNCWDADSLGNHRVVVNVIKPGKVVYAKINWRRRDIEPQNIRIIIQDAQTKQKVLNVKTGTINREFGEIFFEPTSGKGNYYVYYMPYKNEGRSNYPKGVYLTPENIASVDWLSAVSNEKNIPAATVQEIQSIDSLNSFYPMEVIATADETKKILKAHTGDSYILFPEDRMHPIKMQNDLPQRWAITDAKNNFTGNAAKGEWYAFQVGVFAIDNLEDVNIEFSDLKSSTGMVIASKYISCINKTGTEYNEKPFTATVNVAQGKVQSLWCGIDVPINAAKDIYKGKVKITAKGKASKEINFTLIVSDKVLADGGISEPWKQTRLKWLNSTMAQNNTVIDPYTPLIVADTSVSLLGRKIFIGKDGLPAQVQTFFTPEMTSIGTTANNLFTEPAHFHFNLSEGNKAINLEKKGFRFTEKTAGTVKWEAVNSSPELKMDVDASLEFDGFLNYHIKVTALQDIDLNEINFHLPFQPSVAKYTMGLGLKGGNRPDSVLWKWDVATKNQDGAWIGNVNAGLQFSLRDEKYARPLNTNFYLQKPLLLPSSWGNGNKGGIDIFQKGNSVLMNAYSGSRTMKKGDVLYYNFTLLITPFHPINTDFQWKTKFYHSYKPIDTAKAAGATVVNIHHANEINPWINYPFIEWRKMKAYIDEAHNKGMKVKIYNTVRELSNHAYETFPLRSLGHEIYSTGKGGGFSWLQEHIGDDYIAAWFVPQIKDAAIVNSGMSRWHNYYVEGMNWLAQNVGIDGIYLDDVAFDRITMKRIKRVLTKDNHPGIIDFHSANQFNKSDGFNNSANLYMEHFPFINRLWFGEYFDYEKNNPDFFLTEVSGIPFGLMGEMLQDGGNPWRGMIYGMTNRMPWSDDADPRPLWKLWDDFGMVGTEMIGYWSDNCPVKTSNEKVLTTVYKKKGAALISIASWADQNVNVKLIIDWVKLGIDPAKATIVAHEIKNFQKEKVFAIEDDIPVEKNKGWLLIIK